MKHQSCSTSRSRKTWTCSKGNHGETSSIQKIQANVVFFWCADWRWLASLKRPFLQVLDSYWLDQSGSIQCLLVKVVKPKKLHSWHPQVWSFIWSLISVRAVHPNMLVFQSWFRPWNLVLSAGDFASGRFSVRSPATRRLCHRTRV